MRIQQISTYNTNKNNFKANVHIDLETAKRCEQAPKLKRLVDLLKKPEVTKPDIYLSIRSYENTASQYRDYLNAQFLDQFGNVADERLGYLGLYNKTSFYLPYGVDLEINYDNDQDLIAWINKKLAQSWKDASYGHKKSCTGACRVD